MRTCVVYVHGLWLNGWEAVLLRRRLARDLGCNTAVYAYPSVGADAITNARGLGEFLNRLDADVVHLVAHSLGGLMVLELFNVVLSPGGTFPGAEGLSPEGLPPGRIVLLGSPVQGSSAARQFARLAFGRAMMGLTASEVLVAPGARRWSGARELGVIAGSLPLGFGRLVGPLAGPNDGTVRVDETRLPGAVEHLTLRVSHSALVYSPEVARQVAAFLRDGRFT